MPKYTPTQYSPPYTGKQELLLPADLEIYKKAEAAAQEATKEARAKHEMHKKENEAFRKAIKALLAKSKGGSRRRRAQKSSRKSSKRAFRATRRH